MDHLHVLVVALDGVHHDLVFAVFAGGLSAEFGVRAFLLEVDGLADVVEEPRSARHGGVQPQLRGHAPGQLGHLLGVVQHVLAIGGAVPELAHEFDDLGVWRIELEGGEGFLAGGLDVPLDLLGGLGHHLLNLAGMDLAGLDQAFEGLAGDLARDGVEARDDHRVRVVVVDEELHARLLLEIPDVSSLVADEAPLDALVGELEDGGRALDHLVRGHAFDGQRDDLLGLHLRRALGVFLDLADQVGRLVLGFALEVGHQLLLSLFHREP